MRNTAAADAARGACTEPVVIDARAAARPELGGVERWARELATRLPALRPGGYVIAAPRPAFSHRAGHAWEQVALPLIAARRRARWLLCPANLAPLATRVPVALVIHDVAPLREPSWYSPAYVRLQRALLPALARRAALVIVPSAFSRDEVAATLGVDAVVVPGGVGERFRPDADAQRARVALGLAARPYVLCVAGRSARKNLGVLDATVAALRALGVDLAIAGGGRPQFNAGAFPTGARDLGAVPDELLPGLYAGASATVLPSLYEGFGLPCLEAMACGSPVVASCAGALPDVCSDAARLVDPADAAAFARAIEGALNDPLAALAGRARAALFTWAASAATIDALLHERAATVPGPR